MSIRNMRLLGLLACIYLMLAPAVLAVEDVPCQWNSHAGATFNLQPLSRIGDQASYTIRDGDIPCTPDIEPSFDYAFNLCADVTHQSINTACSSQGKSGAVLQWLTLGSDSQCYIVGHYDPKQDDLYYKLLDGSDPSKGISMTYPSGEKCSLTGVPRRATIDVQCDNTAYKVVSANEPTTCDYHLIMKSYHGCPAECPITGNGLCDSHGHCAYDYKKSQSYCYCNDGYSGNACNVKASSSNAYDGYSVQLGLLITLLIITILLIGGIGFIVYRISKLRQDQAYEHLPSSHGTEMVETVHF